MSASKSLRHEEIVRTLVEAKAVDFAAIGKAFEEIGPSLAVLDEPWEGFCGTMRRFIILYKIGNPGVPVEELAALKAVSNELG
jgi:hypothetical protein